MAFTLQEFFNVVLDYSIGMLLLTNFKKCTLVTARVSALSWVNPSSYLPTNSEE